MLQGQNAAISASENDVNIRQQRILDSSNNARKRKPLPSRVGVANNLSGRDVEPQGCPPGTAPTPPQRAPPAPPSIPAASAPPETNGDQALLLDTASAARWRRQEAKPSNSRNSTLAKLHSRANSELVLQVKVMEEVHGVDVSWLHHPNKGIQYDVKYVTKHSKHKHSQSSPDVRRDVKATPSTSNGSEPRKPVQKVSSDLSKLPSPSNVTPPTPAQPSKDSTNAVPSTPTPPRDINKALPKRPSMLARNSSERVSQDGSSRKRSSWMNSLSSKFSTTPERPGPTPAQLSRQQSNTSVNGPQTPSPNSNPATPGSEAVEENEPYTPAKPKESSSSFFSSITRRLSSASQAGNIPKAQGTGGVCPRKVLNVDPNRERCLVPEMDPARLRRVSFCVDVEIAGGPRYIDEEEDDEDKMKRKKEFKMKERAEGEALKRPDALAEEKDEEGEPKLEAKANSKAAQSNEQKGKKPDENGNGANGMTEEERESAARKREKKQKSEAERKERKEKRRKRAEENGQIPVELMLDGKGGDGSSPPSDTANGSSTSLARTPTQPQPNATKQDRPTTDPARIYRRCCQLRESPILKRITEQLSRPTTTLPAEPGVVQCLDLTGSRLQLADVISLGDWLAVVPVKHLKLEDADLSDEGVRCVLAGLLAAKRPEPTKRKSLTPRHRQGIPSSSYTERAGVVEKITLKNNPRLTRVGWKHISLFLYMCRSLKTIDLSMNFFPDTLPPSAHVTPIKSPSSAPYGNAQDLDAAEALYKCLSERLGGRRLEELLMSECGLTSPQIRKVVDGAIVAGVSRLGLAGNSLDDEGLQHVLHYLRSGVCMALDVGGNDLRGKLNMIAEAINTQVDHPCWGLSLAGCNLDSASLKPLFAALVKLPNFRFIDLSHNRDLCLADNGLITLLRRYIGQMKDLKRVHLADVGMSPKQAIALADILPEGERLAHLSLLGNDKLTALANAKGEEEQEEACALYASLMASVRVSQTLICIDVDVPAPDNSEVVKALAKQIVAYSLRNMEQFAIAEATGGAPSTTNATTVLAGPHGGERAVREISVPDVLLHLVGHVEGSSENHDRDPPAPDEDYIIGGAGVVKALQYVLGEKETESRRASNAPTPSGTMTPIDRPGSSAGLVDQGKAKKMSKNLLGSARQLRARLQPALAKEAIGGDDMAYRRLLGLDQTLQSMITRFEEEYPETRISAPSAAGGPSETSSLTDQSTNQLATIKSNDPLAPASDDEQDDLDELTSVRPTVSRHNSDVSLASRALSMEEGRLHRIGQQLRREVIDSPRSTEGGADWAPWRKPEQSEQEAERFKKFREKIEGTSGEEIRKIIEKEEGWDGLLRKIGGTYEDLRKLQEQDPEAWEQFKVAQERAREHMKTSER
ncbi:Microtubules assembly and stabilization protein [Saxophila tyrrhenica]|uniref:Microtubules assembly and stabilization protein n=1 Tax=Saxophila tyrrhenica TaxID=1690608 RepID=A0AAV9PF51_9PEZI|nr:Microtubules assembly and stabilization protein [Saxophila tyrrhenica]